MQKLEDKAIKIIKDNDLGGYTVPTHGLYPFQWNWDSCFAALGFNTFNEDRAWQEIETLFEHQWEDGMVPHIIFHQEDDGYFPGPEVYQTNRAKTQTSGFTNPPVAGFIIRRLYESSKNKEEAKKRVEKLLPKIAKWHNWFFECRDPQNEGLVSVIHPWETGRDNSVDFDEALAKVPTEGVSEFVRKDITHVDQEQRPKKEEYQRYIWLIQTFRALNWDNKKLLAASPFNVVDPGFNAILFQSASDIAFLAKELGFEEIAAQNREISKKGCEALDSLWNEELGQYVCFDRYSNSFVKSPSSGGILPLFAPISDKRATQLVKRLNEIKEVANYLVPSHDPSHKLFDKLRYWRGPVWLIVNFMIADGLRRKGYDEIVEDIISDSFKLIKESDFAEYYDPLGGTPCGGQTFTWTAAIFLEFYRTNKDLEEK